MNVELELTLINETDDAYLLTDGDTEAWVPRSLIVSMEPLDGEDEYEVTMPEYLATDKGFV